MNKKCELGIFQKFNRPRTRKSLNFTLGKYDCRPTPLVSEDGGDQLARGSI